MGTETWAVIPRLSMDAEAVTAERKASLLSAAGYRGGERFPTEAEAVERAGALLERLGAELPWRVDVWAPTGRNFRERVRTYGAGEAAS